MSVKTEDVAEGAFATGYSLFADAWIEIEIVGVPYIADHGGRVVEAWAPSMDLPYSYTIASVGWLRPTTKLARELLRLKPVRGRTP
jgi:hypothetical protein